MKFVFACFFCFVFRSKTWRKKRNKQENTNNVNVFTILAINRISQSVSQKKVEQSFYVMIMMNDSLQFHVRFGYNQKTTKTENI